ncbi:hypothetical protein JHL22_05195 [Advenella sp. WQ 585]|uniref:Uncharacterized protein n=1 Tax=Advenella mandrilli TaxID=2800330 RepID=A0ABS1E9Y5_9BURK|nr:hypothetical protein [Advenella mandrilli]MBK1780607.1 hypothetical protein [Advenella mandrilli]
MNIRPLESLTKEELIEIIQREREGHNEEALNAAPEGWRLVPIVPTLEMLYAALIAWKADGLKKTSTMYTAMIKSAPQPAEPCPDCTPGSPVVNDSLTDESTGTERERFEYWAKVHMGMDITPNESCGYVSKKTLGAWYAWGAENRCREKIDEAMRGEG